MNAEQPNRGRRLMLAIAGAVFAAVIAVILFFSLYTVREWEQAVVTQFGEIIGEPRTEAGLHMKAPWQEARMFDKRLLRWDGSETTTITRDRRTVNIDVTARWRIDDAAQFLRSVRSENRADSRLNGIIAGAIKDEIAKFQLYEIVRSTNRILEAKKRNIAKNMSQKAGDDLDADELATLGQNLPPLETTDDDTYKAGRPIVLDNILEEARQRLKQIELGIHLEDVLIKQLGYIEEIESNVYAQMNAELQKIAAGFRSKGEELAEERLGEMQKELAIIESEATERAEKIRGEAEAEAIKIYADAYSQAPEFYKLTRSLEAYQKVLQDNTTMVLTTDSPLYETLKQVEAPEDPKANSGN